MQDERKVSWSEVRDAGEGQRELFFLIAEPSGDGWEFYERSAWELRWHLIPSTERLLTRLTAEVNGGN